MYIYPSPLLSSPSLKGQTNTITDKTYLVPQLVPPVHERRAGHILIMMVAGPRLLTDGKMDVLDDGHAGIFTFGVVEHVVVYAAVHFQGPRTVI